MSASGRNGPKSKASRDKDVAGRAGRDAAFCVFAIGPFLPRWHAASALRAAYAALLLMNCVGFAMPVVIETQRRRLNSVGALQVGNLIHTVEFLDLINIAMQRNRLQRRL